MRLEGQFEVPKENKLFLVTKHLPGGNLAEDQEKLPGARFRGMGG